MEDATPTKPVQPQIHLPTSLLENATMEPLRVILNPYRGIKHVPNEIGSGDEATMVFVELNNCFKRAGQVAEGLLGNIIWGFSECGYDPRAVAAGLTKLRSLGYIKYSDAMGNPVFEFGFDPDKPIWIRYTDKFIATLA